MKIIGLILCAVAGGIAGFFGIIPFMAVLIGEIGVILYLSNK